MTRWTTDQLAEHLARIKAPVPAAVEPAGPKFRSKLEAEYAQMLEAQARSGLIKSWMYEGITVRLADGVRFTVDFNVLALDGSLSMVEVKGPYMRDDARIKLRVAARTFSMFGWFLSVKRKGAWEVTQL